MLARLLFVLHLAGWVAGAMLIVVALGEGSWERASQAGLCFALALAFRAWLQHAGRLQECIESFDTMFDPPDADTSVDPELTGADRLAELVERRARLEGQRGTPGFDPWELQQVRRDIITWVEQHPGLAHSVDRDWSRPRR